MLISNAEARKLYYNASEDLRMTRLLHGHFFYIHACEQRVKDALDVLWMTQENERGR